VDFAIDITGQFGPRQHVINQLRSPIATIRSQPVFARDPHQFEPDQHPVPPPSPSSPPAKPAPPAQTRPTIPSPPPGTTTQSTTPKPQQPRANPPASLRSRRRSTSSRSNYGRSSSKDTDIEYHNFQGVLQVTTAPKHIPRIFHSIWLGSPLPKEYGDFRASWVRHNPGWELMCWSDENLPELINRREYDSMISYAGKADIVRVELLARWGGVYVDADFECLQSIEPICAGSALWLSSDTDGSITNSIIGSVPGHPFIEALVEAIPLSVASQARASCYDTTGPGLFTRVYEERCRSGLPVPIVLPRAWFFPYGGHERHRRYERFPDAYAVHHWGGSWLSNYDTPKERVRRLLMKSRLTRRLLYSYHSLKQIGPWASRSR